jgi:hypothetical protein
MGTCELCGRQMVETTVHHLNHKSIIKKRQPQEPPIFAAGLIGFKLNINNVKSLCPHLAALNFSRLGD